MSDEEVIEEAERAGFDIHLLDLNLALTPTQRIERHQSALDLVIKLENSRKNRNENPE